MSNRKVWLSRPPQATAPRELGAASWRPSVVRYGAMPGAKCGGSTPAHKKALAHLVLCQRGSSAVRVPSASADALSVELPVLARRERLTLRGQARVALRYRDDRLGDRAATARSRRP